MNEYIKRNIYAFAVAGITAVFGLLFTIVFSRLLSPFDFGILSTFLVTVMGLSSLTDWGFTPTIKKFVGTAYYSNMEKLSDYISYLMLLKAILVTAITSIVFILSPYLASTILHNADFTYVFQLIAVATWFYAMVPFFEAFVTSANRYDLTTFAALFMNSMKLVIPALIILFAIKDVSGAIIGVVIAFALGAIFYYFNFLSVFKEHFHPSLKFTKPDSDFKIYLTFASGLVLLSFLDVFDVLLLNYFRSPVEVAFYKAALAIISGFMLISSVVNKVFFTSFIELDAKKQYQEQIKLFNRLMILLFVIGVILAILLIIFSAPILQLIYPAEYIAADLPLKILALTLIPNYILSACMAVVLSKGNIKNVFYLSLGTLVVDNILNVLWIPVWGVTGACLSTAIMDFISTGILLKWAYADVRRM